MTRIKDHVEGSNRSTARINSSIISLTLIPLFILFLLLFTDKNSNCISFYTSFQPNFIYKNTPDTEKHKRPVIEPSPAPNTVIVLADSSAVHNDYLTIHIASVIAYGSATPVLTAGTIVDVNVSGIISDKKPITEISAIINSCKPDTLVLLYLPVVGLEHANRHWTLIQIH